MIRCPFLSSCADLRTVATIVLAVSASLAPPGFGQTETRTGNPDHGATTRGDPGFFTGYLENQGFEHIIAGPNVDPDFGFRTAQGYRVDEMDISGDGRRIWFTLYDFFGDPQYEVWSIFSDGAFPRRSDIPAGTVEPGSFHGNLFPHTDLDGDIAVFDSGTRFSRATPGVDLEFLFERVGADFGLTAGQKRVTDDGSRFLYLDTVNEEVHSVDLKAGTPVSVVIANPNLLQFMGRAPRTMKGFDMSADGHDWFTTAENFFSDVARRRDWLIHGQGVVPGPDIDIEDTPTDERILNQIEVTDDGQTMVYCPTFNLGENGVCYVQTVGTEQQTEITDDGRLLGGHLLSDNGDTLYLHSDAPFASNYGFFERLGRNKRRVAGTQRFSGTANPTFTNARISDDGRTMIAPVPQGLYLLHNAADIPLDFPQLSAITHFFEGDEMVVRAFLNAPDGIERIFTLPLYRGLEPTRSVPVEENPLWRERSGGGVNWNTTFTQVGPILWERRIPMDGKRDYLNRHWSIRVVVVDHTGHRSTFYDYPISISFADDFESGDTSAWWRTK